MKTTGFPRLDGLEDVEILKEEVRDENSGLKHGQQWHWDKWSSNFLGGVELGLDPQHLGCRSLRGHLIVTTETPRPPRKVRFLNVTKKWFCPKCAGHVISHHLLSSSLDSPAGV